jgi:hypothetical protein
MTDSLKIRELAEERLKEAGVRRAELRAFLKVFDELSDATPAREAPQERVHEPVAETETASAKRWGVSMFELMDLAEQVLRERRQPMTASAIAKILVDQGVRVGVYRKAADPGNYLSSVLSQSSRFRNLKGAGYVLAESPKIRRVK